MVAEAGFEPRILSKQNRSLLPLPIHHLPKGLVASSANTRPHQANQFSPDLSTSFSNPNQKHVVSNAKVPRSANRETRLFSMTWSYLILLPRFGNFPLQESASPDPLNKRPLWMKWRHAARVALLCQWQRHPPQPVAPRHSSACGIRRWQGPMPPTGRKIGPRANPSTPT